MKKNSIQDNLFLLFSVSEVPEGRLAHTFCSAHTVYSIDLYNNGDVYIEVDIEHTLMEKNSENHYQLSLLQNDDFRSASRHAKNFYRRHIIDIPRIKI